MSGPWRDWPDDMTAPDAPRDVPAEGPATEAGRAHLDEWWPDLSGPAARLDSVTIRAAIARRQQAALETRAIEQQARQAALDEVRREVRAMPTNHVNFTDDFGAYDEHTYVVKVYGVIDILDRLSGSRP